MTTQTAAELDAALAEVDRLRGQATIVAEVRRTLHGCREDDVVPLVAGLSAGTAAQHAALQLLRPALAQLVGQAELLAETHPDAGPELRDAIAAARAALDGAR